MIQNNGAAVMYIYPGTTAAAQAAGTAAGLQIAASGGTRDLSFGAPNGVYNGQVVIAGTGTQVFVAIECSGESSP
jgi:hypothetical protein